eukprot:gnl/Dysnectes_brevis/5616_a8177_389.p1 GENE.gnl/Dysnectes_brevis/5616_a8177_389~~gnl/Dysnectes_brevis/5616_a8177_389.p1  ORF type:complete len:255 (+),score=70.22 gnl/Dysnectes_brevis/5616_a8177_389:59-823(+)
MKSNSGETHPLLSPAHSVSSPCHSPRVVEFTSEHLKQLDDPGESEMFITERLVHRYQKLHRESASHPQSYIDLRTFLQCASSLCELFDFLSINTLKPLKIDLHSNMKKLRKAAIATPLPTVQQLLLATHQLPPRPKSKKTLSASFGVLWLRRSMEFAAKFIRLLLEQPDKHPRDLAERTYREVLRPFHGVLVRALFGAGLKTIPSRKSVLSKHDPAVIEKAFADLHQFVDVCDKVIEELKQWSVAFGYEDTSKV